jgi:hypothetical protein
VEHLSTRKGFYVTTPNKLGKKWECSECGTRFYDLGKSEIACPKCGLNLDHGAQRKGAEETTTKRSSSRRSKETQTKPSAGDVKGTSQEKGD